MKKLIVLSFVVFAGPLLAQSYLSEKIVLFPIKKAEISSIVDTTIKEYKFKEGEKFKKGDELVLLDDRFYKHMYLKSKSAYFGTKKASQYASKVYEHNKTLYEKNAIGEQELEESHLKMINSIVDNEQAKANMEISEIKLQACKIKAPFSGRLISKIENEHDYVREGQPILEIADDNSLLAILNLPSDRIKKINLGMKLKFKIDETNSEVDGTVYSISGSVNPGSRTFEVKAIIDNPEQKFKIGMSGNLISKV